MEVAAKSEARLMLGLGQSQKVKISTRQFVCGPGAGPILVDLRRVRPLLEKGIRLFLVFGRCDCGIPLFDN